MTQDIANPVSFDLDEITSVDQAEMVIRRPDGTPTPWVWIIAGPGHPNSIALEKRVTEEAIARNRAQESARVNGKKWKGDSESADELKRRSAGYNADRVLGWRPENITINGEPLPFSRENVVKVLMDPSRGGNIVRQLDDFFSDERSFSKRSETI